MALPNPDRDQLLIEGSLSRAVEVFKAEWSAAKNIGPHNAETMLAQIRYADVLRMAGDYEEAAGMYEDLLEKMPSWKTGRMEQREIDDQVLDIKLSLVSIVHRMDVKKATDMIVELDNFVSRMPVDDAKIPLKKKLAETMRDMARYERALAYFEEIYNFKSNNDPHNFDTLSSHVDVVTVYLEQGRYMKAMDVLQSIHEEAYNVHPEHECTLKAERYIADVCVHYGMTLIACMKYENIAKIQERESPRSLDALTTLHKLSLAYLKDGKPRDALQKIESVYDIRIVETPWHPDTKRVEIDFMMMLLREGDISRATRILLRALESKYECFDFELVVDIPRNIAMAFRKLNEPDKAEEAIRIYEYLYQKQGQMSRLGRLHPKTLLTKTDIAETYFNLERNDEALQIFEQVLNDKLNVLNNDSIECLDVRKRIAELYKTREAFHESFDHYLEVHRNERMYLGIYHDVTVDTEEKLDNFCLENPESILLRAIIADDLQSVINICNGPENVDIDAQDYYGCTALHTAVRAGHPKIVKFLLSKGASLFVKSRSGKIPRELAQKNDVKNIFNFIIQLFMDVKLRNESDMADLLSYDASIINVRDEEGKTLLHWACQKGYIEIVRLLLNKGADPRVNDESSESALDVATKLNHVEIIKEIERHLEGPTPKYLSIQAILPGSVN